MKKRSERDANTARWLQYVRQSQKFSPAADPFPEAWDGKNLISWRWSLYTCTYRPSLVRIDARDFELSCMV